MLQRKPRLNPLQFHKELLIAESELNRVQLAEDWQSMSSDIRALTVRATSISSLASTVALVVTGIAALRTGRALVNGPKSSWLAVALKGAKVAGSIWMAIRSRPRNQKDN